MNNKTFCDIFVNVEYRKLGYAFAAKNMLYNSTHETQIYSWVDKNNIASIKLQNKMGCSIVKEQDEKYLFKWDRFSNVSQKNNLAVDK